MTLRALPCAVLFAVAGGCASPAPPAETPHDETPTDRVVPVAEVVGVEPTTYTGPLGPGPLPLWPPPDPRIEGPCPVPFLPEGWAASDPAPASAKPGDLLGFARSYPEFLGASGEVVTLAELYRQRTGRCDVNRDWGKFLGFAGENSGPTFVARHGGTMSNQELRDVIDEVRASR